MRLILRILINAVGLWVTSLILPSFALSDDILGVLIVAVIFGVVNALIRPIVKLLSLPLTVITLGLFTFVINALMLLLTAWLAGDFLSLEGDGLIDRLLTALIASIIISLVSTALSWILHDDKD